MADSKKSDIFGDKKPSANETKKEREAEELRVKDKAYEQRQAQQDKADIAEERRVDARQAQQDKVGLAKVESNKEALTFTANKDRVYTRTYPSGKVPVGQWGLAVWTRDAHPMEHPCFLDNQGDWWFATTTNQNGVNPAVEKTEEPVGWRAI